MDHEEQVPPVTGVAGSLALATRKYRTRHASMEKSARKRPMSLHSLRAAHTPVEPQMTPLATHGARPKFRAPSASRCNSIYAHDATALLDAHDGKHGIPHPPTEPKPQKGVRPRLRTPALQRDDEADALGEPVFPWVPFSRTTRCGSGSSLEGVMALSKTDANQQ